MHSFKSLKCVVLLDLQQLAVVAAYTTSQQQTLYAMLDCALILASASSIYSTTSLLMCMCIDRTIYKYIV